ncbi:MAG: HAD hydrolase family protein [Armatimonadetes bacterium]|nr:HAD hydrolase family protein [Armatimonadota bacterium]
MDIRRHSDYKPIKIAFFDVDGVLTDGTKFYHEDGTVSKLFHDQDSTGLRMLTQNGVEVIIISADERVNRNWAEHQSLPFYCTADKAETVAELLDKKGYDGKSAAFVGDDLRDLEAMKLVRYSMAPANASQQVRRVARFRLRRAGGSGAGREAAELILRINRFIF